MCISVNDQIVYNKYNLYMPYTHQNNRWGDQRLKIRSKPTMPGLSIHKPGRSYHRMTQHTRTPAHDNLTIEKRLEAIGKYLDANPIGPTGRKPSWWDEVMEKKKRNPKKDKDES